MEAKRLETDARRVVLEELERTRQRIADNHIGAGQRASGKTADSITAIIEEEAGIIIGGIDARPYFAATETGTKPWRTIYTRQRRDGSNYPSAPKWFIDVIRDWAVAKGIPVGSSWGIATRIMTEGSKLFREGGRADIFSYEIPELLRRIAERLAGLFEAQLVESILRKTE